MNNTMRGIVPTAKPRPKPVATPAPATSATSATPATDDPSRAGAAKMPAPSAFDPKTFLKAMSTIPTSWSQLSIHDKLVRVMAYLPQMKNSDAIAGAISATDAYVYQVTSPHGPMLQGVPVGKAAPTVVSPVLPESKVDIDPRAGYVTDVPQKPLAPPHVDIPKPLVVFDPKTGRMRMPGPASARQATTDSGSGAFWGYLFTFIAGAVVGVVLTGERGYEEAPYPSRWYGR